MESDINIPPASPEMAPEEKITKKRLLIGGLAVLILILAGLLIYKAGKKEEAPKSLEETLAEKQIRELEALRGESKPFTEEEIKAQVNELEKLRGTQESFSQQETEAQLEELNNLRSNQ